jgi:hypothetical protein
MTDGLFIATAQKTPEGPSDAVYIAAMHPEVGKAIATWLRLMADLDSKFELSSINDNRMLYQALGLADLLLAGAS